MEQHRRWPIDLEEGESERDALSDRASLVLKFLALLNVAAFVLASIHGLVPESLLAVVAFNAAGVLLAVVYLVVALAIDRSQPWAPWTARALLVVLLIWGTYSFVATLAGGSFRIPIVMLAAGFALLLPAERAPAFRLDWRGVAIIVLTFVLLASQAVNQPVFGWGGLLDVDDSDLNASLTVDCGVPGAGPPESVAIAYEWSWSRDAPLPNEEDQI
ncbi:MAG: hypothetical protein ACREMY_31180, partial [bacterium]